MALDGLKFDEKGLITVVVQDARTKAVLMVAYMNAETLEQTLQSGRMTYWSRSRNRVWVKGETSGHYQLVRRIWVDCDGDALLFEVEQVGGIACHTGHPTCFYRTWQDGQWRKPEADTGA
ncbi:MAG: phosphoribosyl-AMP cyclohydrolase [Bacteroidetes bacterium]|nr:phosphoribosyl-AMP cyclohydrolase [Rhodothermia bacterium]MCS7155254.1 phosphoribosyl-AMP cyclohydrolase [Bacteroidota bacterium]MCX7907839.1 phosphoribosyl-AMP cyclohydrolase [Bacteroidota bacterium]MDW8138658.1 phosphoribosyl-AMP cyclohydrolase [Bacteroidota bacterium]MDW8284756.1 phosphoribosyl-AMP cyclohydrolase [Bacteroidota bacterium]